jgi:hypothetical protein
MSVMKDYVTPQERMNVFPKTNLKQKFIIDEINNIFYDRCNLDSRQKSLEASLHFIKMKGDKYAH